MTKFLNNRLRGRDLFQCIVLVSSHLALLLLGPRVPRQSVMVGGHGRRSKMFHLMAVGKYRD